MMIDLLLTDDFDLDIQNGDFVIGDSTKQNQQCILLATQGEYKEHPEVGVGMINHILEDDIQQMLINAQRQFEHDGMIVNTLESDENGNLLIDATYE